MLQIVVRIGNLTWHYKLWFVIG